MNRLRAQHVASSTNTCILECCATDRPSLDALCARSDLPSQKFEWLNRHDRESGDLYGVLPLIKSMPVAMAIHIDRTMDKRVVKGRVGFVHSWVLAKDESSTFKHGTRMLTRMPKVVFVEFLTKDGTSWDWTLPGPSEPGVYPIVPNKRLVFR